MGKCSLGSSGTLSRKKTLEDIKGRLVQTEAHQQGPLGPTSTSMLMVHLTISASDDRSAALEKQIDNLTTLVRETKLTQRHSPSVPLQSTMPPARANHRCHHCGGDDHLWCNCPFPNVGQGATSSLINGQWWLLDSGT
jgi:ribosomal protein L17